MRFRTMSHLRNRLLRFSSVKRLENRRSFELIHKLAILLICWNYVCDYIINVQVWVDVAEECTPYKGHRLVELFRTKLFSIRKNLDQKHVNNGVDSEENLFLWVFVGQTDLQTIFAVISRFELIVVVILTSAGAKFPHKF